MCHSHLRPFKPAQTTQDQLGLLQKSQQAWWISWYTCIGLPLNRWRLGTFGGKKWNTRYCVFVKPFLSNFMGMNSNPVPSNPRMISKDNINKDDEGLRQELLERLIDCRLMKATNQILFNDPQRLALRELPHGNWSNVYVLYQAHCRSQGFAAASKATFFAVSQLWRSCLRFHKKSQHTKCFTCSRLQMELRNTTVSCQAKNCNLWTLQLPRTPFVFGLGQSAS